MIRVIKVSTGQISQEHFTDSYYTRDFEAPELEEFIKTTYCGTFLGIEIVDDDRIKKSTEEQEK
jgi:hypothetical protein